MIFIINHKSPRMRACLLLLALMICLNCYAIVVQPPPAYNVSDSQQLAKLSALAFCGSHCVSTWTCGWGKTIPVLQPFYMEHPMTKAAGYVGYNSRNNQIVLSFRGTSNAQNWIEDANFQKVAYFRCQGCKIHTGFYVDYLFFQEEFNGRVTALLKKYPTASIVTTGHSLGAAISAVCAMELKALFPGTKVFIHNFGQPRLGNIGLSDYMSKTLDGIYRVVHNRDLVPHAPPDLPGFDYHHPAHEVFFNLDLSVYKVCDATGEDITCSNKFFPAYDPNDHDHYFIYISQVQC